MSDMQSRIQDKESHYQQNSFFCMLKLKILANLLLTGDLNNIFGFVGYGFGGYKDKTTNENNDESCKNLLNGSEKKFHHLLAKQISK